MERFTAEAVDDPTWAESCARLPGEKAVDGVQCSDSAYYNMTKYLDVSSMTNEQI